MNIKFVFYALAALFLSTSNVKAGELPVIFIHKTDSDYLQHSLWQAKQYNSRVILIGDEHNNHYEGVEHYHYGEYFSSASEFEKVFQYKSPNPYHYSLFCFQRWFILKEFMHAHQIEKCFYCDSDVMLYCDINKEYEHFARYDFSLLLLNEKECSGHSSFLTLHGMEKVCAKIVDFYQHFEELEKDMPLISDMFVFRYIVDHTTDDDLLIGDLTEIINGGTFDERITATRPLFASSGGRKKIKWKKNTPYAFYRPLNKWVRMKSLHFQGPSKKSMSKYKKAAR